MVISNTPSFGVRTAKLFIRLAVYPIEVTDMRLRADIAEYQHKRNYIRIHPVTEQFLRDTEALKQDNLKRCKELMEQHPLALFLENHADILERLERETE